MRSRPNSWHSTLTQLGFTRKKKSFSTQRQQTRKLRVESLEDRRLLAVFSVDNVGDGMVDAQTQQLGTLRQAIYDAKVNPGPDTIEFNAAVFDTVTPQTISLNAGELLINDSVTIDAETFGVIISAGNSSTVMSVNLQTGEEVTISGLTLTDGLNDDVAGKGGGLSFSGAGSLTVLDSVITGNSTINTLFSTFSSAGGLRADIGQGGNLLLQRVTVDNNYSSEAPSAISASVHELGTLLINESSIYDNTMGQPGSSPPEDDSFGTVDINASGQATISNSTVNDNRNHVGTGGGIRTGANLDIINSTISGNYSISSGGGVFMYGRGQMRTVRIMHSTITNNFVGDPTNPLSTSAIGGGILFQNADDEVLSHSIVANNENRLANENHDIGTFQNQFGPALVSADFNIIETTLGNIDDTDLILSGSNNSFVDPLLGMLDDNGGPTLTHLPLTGSPAIDAGDPQIVNPPRTDQRGYYRIFNNVIDIGAVEVGSIPLCRADFDGDMDVDGSDFLIWMRSVGTVDATWEDGDANGDGLVDGEDLAIWEAEYGCGIGATLTGDFNGDLVVDTIDLAIVTDGLAQGITSGAMLIDGDADGNGVVDALDYLAWQVRYGQEIGSTDWLDSALMFDPTALESGQIIVSNPLDDNDGDFSLGDLSLREAIALADSTSGSAPDTIVFTNNVLGTLSLTQGDLDIDSDVDIVGPGSGLLTIDAQSNSRGFNITDGVSGTLLDVSISGLTVANGSAGSGAGIYNLENLTLEDVVLDSNIATSLGGGLYHDFGTLSIIDSTFNENEATHGGGAYGFFKSIDSLEVTGSTFSLNEASSLGGGLFFKNVDAGSQNSSAKIVNSTFSGNTAGSHSGGLRIRGSSQATTELSIINSTITGNDAPTAGGVFSYPTVTTTLHNTILAGNTVSGSATWTADASGNIGGTTGTPSAYNIVGVGNGGLGVSNGVNNNTVGTVASPEDPGLAGLADNGGSTKTHALLTSSQAIDGGDLNSALFALNGADFVDQRGYNRLFDDPTQSGFVDIGAYERGLIVTTANDENDGTFDFADLSLREAISALSYYYANGLPASNVIEFADSVVATGEINLSLGSLVVANDVNLTGPGADQLEIDASGADHVFDVASGVTASISGLTATGAAVSGIENAGDLTLDGMEVSDNLGIGIFSNQSPLILLNSTIAGNGDYGLGSTGANTTATNVTISGNNGTGAIITSNGNATFTNVTIVENDSISVAGGIITAYGATVTLNNSIVADNISSSGAGLVDLYEASGSFSSNSSNNLIGDAGNTGLVDGVTTAQLGLTALGDYGGPTRTHSLLAGSLAIDAGDSAFASLYDQRGEDRIADGDADGFASVDIGAIEAAFGTI